QPYADSCRQPELQIPQHHLQSGSGSSDSVLGFVYGTTHGYAPHQNRRCGCGQEQCSDNDCGSISDLNDGQGSSLVSGPPGSDHGHGFRSGDDMEMPSSERKVDKESQTDEKINAQEFS
ncbi:hypothetical protein PFISCL1PPCAC_27861, partial [Pristionchus fissidentatus]